MSSRPRLASGEPSRAKLMATRSAEMLAAAGDAKNLEAAAKPCRDFRELPMITVCLVKPYQYSVLGLTFESRSDLRGAVVTALGEASRGVLRVGDVVDAIDGVPVSGANDAAGRLRAAVGEIIVTVCRAPDGPAPHEVPRASAAGEDTMDGAASEAAAPSESAPALAAEEEDVTGWRAQEEAEEEVVDSRVEAALQGLNEAIATNNEVEAAFGAERRQHEAEQRAAVTELLSLEQQLRPQLRALDDFRQSQREAERAGEELKRVAKELAAAQEVAALAEEALSLQREGASPAPKILLRGPPRDDGWREVARRMRAQRDEARARVRRLRADRHYWTEQTERHTAQALRRAAVLSEWGVADGAMPFLMRKRALSEQRRVIAARELQQDTEAGRAKARVKEAMRSLEAISLDIQAEQQQQQQQQVSEPDSNHAPDPGG